MKRALVIRHVVHEGIAGYREPVEAAGYRIERVAACETDWEATDVLAPDLLVVMGGPMGVFETGKYPWITAEVEAIGRRVRADRPTLGVCLGAQMIAAAMGARVYPGLVREVGFSALTLGEAGEGSPLRHLEGTQVLHWHGDTFDLPDDVTQLASTPIYSNQAFAAGRNVLALQFHAEMGEDPRFHTWLEQDSEYIRGAGVCAATLERDHDRLGPAAARAGQAMLAEWLAGLG